MFTVKLINFDGEYILNEVNTNSIRRLLGASVTQAVNSIGSFTFTVLIGHPCYNMILERQSRVNVYKGTETVFSGYVLKVQGGMETGGIISKKVACEGSLGYLHDTIQTYWTTQDPEFTFAQFIAKFLETHNALTEDFKKIYPGVIINDKPTSNSFTVQYGNSYDVLKYITDRFGGEYRVREESGMLYFDYTTEGFGETVTGTKIKLGRNLNSLEAFNDSTATITRLFVYGAKIDEFSQVRVDISSVNVGLPYIDNTEAIDLYGIISDVLIIEDESDPGKLLYEGKKYLEQHSTVTRSITNTVIDLSVIGADGQSFEVYNSYRLVHEVMGINENVRIIKKSLDINAPHIAAIEIGKKTQTATEIAAEAVRMARQNNLDLFTVAEQTYSRATQTALNIVDEATADMVRTEQLNGLVSEDALSSVLSEYLKKTDSISSDNVLYGITALTAVLEDIENRLSVLEGIVL